MPRKQKVFQKAIYLISSDDFLKAILDIRNKFELPNEGFKTEHDMDQWLEKNVYYTKSGNILMNEIERSVATLIGDRKFDLTPSWQHAIERFLFLNDIEKMQLPVRLDFKLLGDDQLGVVVSSETTKAEYIEAWKEVEYLREFYGMNRPSQHHQAKEENLRRMKLAYDIWRASGSNTDVVLAVNNAYPDLAYTQTEAITDIKNFKKQAGI